MKGNIPNPSALDIRIGFGFLTVTVKRQRQPFPGVGQKSMEEFYNGQPLAPKGNKETRSLEAKGPKA